MSISAESPWALIPVKRFTEAKKRLRQGLHQKYGVSAEALARAMLMDVVESVSGVSDIAGVAVVTSETSISQSLPNVRVIPEPPGCDMNGAIAEGLQTLSEDGVKRVVILPADIPLLTRNDLEQALRELDLHRLGGIPSYDEKGTNLLILDTDTGFTPQFGVASFQKHLQQCRELGIDPAIAQINGISRDMDYLEDVDAFFEDMSNRDNAFASHTYCLLYAAVHGGTTLQEIERDSLAQLKAMAADLRDQHFGNVITYSRKVFIPLTRLCRDVCHYCTFATTPGHVDSPYMSPEAVLAIAHRGKKMGCKEVLLTLGEKPERRYRVARQALEKMGFNSTLEYVAHIAGRVLQETGLLPHINAGCMSLDDYKMLRPVSASMGLMLESVSPRLCQKGNAHFGSPDKEPGVRLKALADAGRAKVPMTTGILIGIGETRQERIDSLLAIRELHQRYGHIQEVIVQNFVAKEGTKMANAVEPDNDDLLWTIAVARLILGAQMSIQVPPNLNGGNLQRLINAGINDWGGVSPLTPDHVNPESPWPQIDILASETAATGKILQQRLTIYPQFLWQKAHWLDSGLWPAVLNLSDGQGLARQDNWVSGVSEHPTPTVREQVLAKKVAATTPSIRVILDKYQSHPTKALSEGEIARLFSARGDDFAAICSVADDMRALTSGDSVSYVVNRNINYTNICSFSCSFCAFSKGKKHGGSGDAPYLKSPGDVAHLAREASVKGAAEVCLQGGIHPSFTGQTYLDICRAVKEAEPDLHIHAFSPLEVWHGAHTLGISVKDFLLALKSVGLRSLPGTAAEILHGQVRSEICPDKLSSEQWLSVIETAHELDLHTTATIMFGHVDTYEHWAAHLLKIRRLQSRTGGFTEFVPLPFVAHEAPVYKRGRARQGPTLREAILMHAVSRIVFHGLIDNIQSSWVKMGLEGAALCLHAGANDLGGVLMNESITRAAGAKHGQFMDEYSLVEKIQASGRQPQRRSTLYQRLAQTGGVPAAQSYPGDQMIELVAV
ncbi:5-amino-6-(D-ribitylamino)uracil--L-tyrosine 4-hydroxyphenyl transferase CofH [Pseudomaricurvus alkylphenolicus]|uniref:5-amino-6-(D-ribitylamino)uracil--L-tyrosine 4-hydroxyphenyl transferase CofH n=1 Tax=Pseudomaricurvus alkylphenolicus TaxID=1306991 RepID=UPI00141EE539|nr:5-amino-6-(D-ribitylamino)uracil--L-tyrosine 4-hydroxyphenyl transferase CofH [Pseudomaricurvus alkylphenolicus]NIB38841.1 5-amino-6-(D-ribitylamino)uracil--L-tyrosine 4-hydroxyphenyl transferase CofH [Pseudomaricurvus alkylphenolicus]